MGGFDLWCCFCGGPFENARAGWLEAVENWYIPEKEEPNPPPAPTKDIVTISEKDGESWSEVVCVGPSWDSFVSSRGTVVDKFGTIDFDDYTMDYGEEESPTLIFHPHCLSFLCRRINTSPEKIWGSLYSPGSDYLEYKQTREGLLNELEYYDIGDFHDQYYHYCVREFRPKKSDGEFYYWSNPNSMKELQWLLARPTVFPVVPSLAGLDTITTSPSTSQAPCMGVLSVPELFNIILDCIIGQDTSQAELAKELQSDDTFTPDSVIQSTEAIFGLLQVNKSLYTAIRRDRQTIFLRLAWMHGWMLPFTHEDWKNWPSENGTFHNGTVFRAGEDQDWRAYLLSFLRKENVHVRNRWRFHKMAVQFARGRSEAEFRWRFEVGELGFRPSVKPSEPCFWEEKEVDLEDEEGDDDDGDEEAKLSV